MLKSVALLRENRMHITMIATNIGWYYRYHVLLVVGFSAPSF